MSCWADFILLDILFSASSLFDVSMQDSRLGLVVFREYPSFFIIFPFYPPHYTGSLRFVRELGFDIIIISFCSLGICARA